MDGVDGWVNIFPCRGVQVRGCVVGFFNAMVSDPKSHSFMALASFISVVAVGTFSVSGPFPLIKVFSHVLAKAIVIGKTWKLFIFFFLNNS